VTLSGIFIDDNDDEAVYAEQMTTRGELKIVHERPRSLTVHSNDIFSRKPDLLALDYRLDEDLGDLDDNEAYKAGAMAQQLRDLAIDAPEGDFPIVLVSSEDKIRDQYEPDKTSHDLFDALYVKSEVNDDKDPVRRELISLCNGYILLKSQLGNFDLVTLTGLEGDDADLLDYQELTLPMSNAAAPHIAAGLLLNQLIHRSGPLIGINEACARFGVDLNHDERISALLVQRSADYRGIFSTGWPRFWSHLVDDLADEVFGKRATGFTAAERAEKLSATLDEPFEAASSTWTKKPDELIAFACACCGEGTEMRHSAGVFESSLPSFSKRRRVCWRCIHDDRYLEIRPSITMDDSDEDLVNAVKAMEFPG
jgi:hypothetical protein